MARSGADVIVAHFKTTAGGLGGAQDHRRARRRVPHGPGDLRGGRRAAPAVLCFAHGGRWPRRGDRGAVSRDGGDRVRGRVQRERLATEAAVVAATRAFKAQRLAAGRDASRRTQRRAR
jgi:predicted TIM-barrel enzyme